MKSVIYILLWILFLSCSTVYKTTEFNIASSPKEPDYENKDSWAVLPQVWNPSLEEIVGKMETDELSLEESIKLFEEGMKLSKICQAALKEAEGKIQKLSKQGDSLVDLEEEG